MREYVVQPGDTLVSIAEKVYGEPRAFTDIYRANEDVILDPYNLTPGTILYIPPSAEEVHQAVHEKGPECERWQESEAFARRPKKS